MKNSVEAKGVSESISLVEMLEALVSGVSDKPGSSGGSIPWAGISLTLAQIRSKLSTVQGALNASEPQTAAPAAPSTGAQQSAPNRRLPREIEILDEATFNREPRTVDTRPAPQPDARSVQAEARNGDPRQAPQRGPLGTLSGRVQVAPTVNPGNGQSGRSRELGVKPSQSSGTPSAEALSNEEAAVAD